MNHSPRPILVGVDFSNHADRALQQAVSMAQRLSVPLHLCYVGDPPPALLDQEMGSSVDYMDFYRQQMARLQGPLPMPTTAHLLLGETVPCLLRLIEDLQPEMVVVGSHGRGVLMRALLGSVSMDLCKRSPVPVLVVPVPGRTGIAALQVPSSLRQK